MSRRFSDEPINLIRRIPSPEQLDAARPVKRSFGGKLGEAAASFARSVAERLGHVTSPTPAETAMDSPAAPYEEPDDVPSEVVAEECAPPDREMSVVESRKPWPAETVDAERMPDQTNPAAAVSSSIQPEELAELRGYLLKQQQDIVRLAAQIQELKSLVISQQQIIEYLSKEVAGGSVSLFKAGITSGVAKQNRSARPKPIMKDKPLVPKGDPIGLPLNV